MVFGDRVAIVKTERTKIVAWVTSDLITERAFATTNPGLAELDPTVGTFDNPVFFSLLLAENNKHIGSICFYNLEPRVRVEYGIRIFNKDYWDKGYGREVTNAMCTYAFKQYPTIERVYLKTPLSNKRSQVSYYKSGFVAYDSGFVDGVSMIFMKRER